MFQSQWREMFGRKNGYRLLHPSSTSWGNFRAQALLALFSLVVGFLIGLHTTRLSTVSTVIPCTLASSDQQILSYCLSVSTEAHLFSYNRSYAEKPSNITNGLWYGLFPSQGGFFQHPQLAPQRSAFSVFHQLHCLVRTDSLLSLFVVFHTEADIIGT